RRQRRFADVARAAIGREQDQPVADAFRGERQQPGMLARGHEASVGVDQHPATVAVQAAGFGIGLGDGMAAHRPARIDMDRGQVHPRSVRVRRDRYTARGLRGTDGFVTSTQQAQDSATYTVSARDLQAAAIAAVYFFFVLGSYYLVRPVREQLGAAAG